MSAAGEEYRRYVAERLQRLVPVFAKASVGDFSEKVDIPDGEDEFTELYTGVQVMLEVIGEQIAEYRELNQSLESRVKERTAELEEAERIAHLGRWEWSVGDGRLKWSDEVFRLYDVVPGTADLSYDFFLGLLPAEERGPVDGAIRRSLATLEPIAVDHTLRCRDGSVRWLHLLGKPVPDERGAPSRVVGTAQDITERKSFEEAIRRSEEGYRDIFNNARDVIFTLSTEGVITSLNPAFGAITGWRTDEWIGRDFGALVHSDDLVGAVERFSRIIAGEILPAHEWRIRSASGEYLVSEMVTTPQFRDGAVTGLLGIARDVTERRRAEEKFRGLLESAPDAMVIVDGGGTINLVNSQTVRLFGYPAGELIGRRIEMLLPESLRNRHTEHRNGYIREPYARPMGLGLELHGRRKDGTEFPVEISLSPMRTNGALLVTAAIRDITERKRSEEQLRLLAHTITSMNECIAITDPERVVRFVNPSFLSTYGFREGEIVGRDISSVFHPDGRPTLDAIVVATASGGWRGEIHHLRRSGEAFPVLLSTSMLRNPAGQPASLLWLTKDMTSENRLRMEVEMISRQRSEDLSRFAASVQSAQEEELRRISRELHDDLGQRLTAMKFDVEVLEELLRNSGDGALRKLRRFGNQLSKLMNDVRRISMNLHPAALDDFGLLIAVEHFCREFGKVHNVRTEFLAPENRLARYEPRIEVALYRIMQESFANIAKHSLAASVTVRLEQREGLLRFSISDDGKGFDPAAPRPAPPARRGLGLISMRERAEFAGGRFTIESRPNGGTTVLVEVPLPV